MRINGRITMVRVESKNLVVGVALECEASEYLPAFQVRCPREPMELDMGDDVTVTISKRCEEGA